MVYIDRAIEFMALLGFFAMFYLYVWLVAISVAPLFRGLWDWVKSLFIIEGDDDYAAH